MGALAGIAAALSFTRYPAVEIEAGLGLELEVIACVVLGGTSIQGGRGSFLGTLLGMVLLSMLASALVFLRVEAAWGRAFQGMVLLLAVVLDALRSARLTGPSVISEESS
jgi:ribose/xylose/arabinose/galactoside ABC-type transport system permease subunit